MNNAKTVSLLLAGLLAATGAIAQTASATSDVPVKAGEASTQTRGQPNMATTNNKAAAPAATASTAAPSTASGAPLQSGTGLPVDSASSTSVLGAPTAPAMGREVPAHKATVTSNVPTKAGEASTMTNGVPNVSTNNANPDGSRLVVPPPTVVSNVPTQAGEASTTVNGRPNANPQDPVLRR